jgi:hypothetical protein
MGSAVMLTGDEHIDAYYLRVRREMQSFPASNNILDILDGPSQSLPMDRASE